MSVVRSSLVCLAAIAVVGCGSGGPPPETSPQPPSPGAPGVDAPREPAVSRPAAPRTHTVRRGDTLWSLANLYNVAVEDFIAVNDLVDPDVLHVGDALIIPGPRSGNWMWPVVGGEILSRFGRRGSDQHYGLDIEADRGQQVLAAWSGVVVYSGDNMRGYGNAIILDHGGGLTSLYGHNSALLVRQGEQVERGQAIALAGDSGNATTVHCHFEVRRGGRALDPMEFLRAASRDRNP